MFVVLLNCETMPSNNNNGNKKKKKSRSNRSQGSTGGEYQSSVKQMPETPASSTVYRGPTEPAIVRESNDLHTLVLHVTNSVASSGAGVINTVFDSAINMQSSPNWADCATLFDEYRVLAMHIKLIPINKYVTATTQVALMTVVDRSDSTALTSLSDAISHASCQEHYVGDTIVRVVRMDSVEESIFNDVSSTGAIGPVQRMFVKLYSTGLAASTSYFQYFATYVVQFRGTA